MTEPVELCLKVSQTLSAFFFFFFFASQSLLPFSSTIYPLLSTNVFHECALWSLVNLFSYLTYYNPCKIELLTLFLGWQHSITIGQDPSNCSIHVWLRCQSKIWARWIWATPFWFFPSKIYLLSSMVTVFWVSVLWFARPFSITAPVLPAPSALGLQLKVEKKWELTWWNSIFLDKYIVDLILFTLQCWSSCYLY